MSVDEHQLAAWYSERRVLVLGGLGFIGSHVTADLMAAGARVTVVSCDLSRHSDRVAELCASGASIVEGDVVDPASMRRAVRDQDVIVWMCGRSGAARSVAEPHADLRTNLVGMLSVLEAMRSEAPAAKLVTAGSRLVYGAPKSLPVDEDHPLVPQSPHGVHQAAVDRYVAIYGDIHGLRATRLRLTNVYGAGQPRGRRDYGILNFFAQEAAANRPITLYGDGAALRDFVFVADVSRAFLMAGADVASDGMAMNIGSGAGISVGDAARKVVQLAGAGRVEHVPWPAGPRAVETGSFVADISRVQRILGWSSRMPLTAGLRATVDSYRQSPVLTAPRRLRT